MKNIFILFALAGLSSCSIVNKAFHRRVNKSDSLTIVRESKDSSVVKDITQIHTDSSKEDNEIVIDFGDSKISVPFKKDSTSDSGIYYYPKNPDEYFSFNQKTGEIRASKVPVKVTVKGSKNAFNFDSLADHSKIELTEKRDEQTKVNSVKKDTSKTVEKKKVPVFQLVLLGLLILLIIWVVKNRKNIWGFIVHFFTGL